LSSAHWHTASLVPPAVHEERNGSATSGGDTAAGDELAAGDHALDLAAEGLEAGLEVLERNLDLGAAQVLLAGPISP
jgi:hypothetical protein